MGGAGFVFDDQLFVVVLVVQFLQLGDLLGLVFEALENVFNHLLKNLGLVYFFDPFLGTDFVFEGHHQSLRVDYLYKVIFFMKPLILKHL